MGIVYAEITLRNVSDEMECKIGIRMEGMDLIINPRGEELVGAHGDEAMYYVI